MVGPTVKRGEVS